MKNEKFVNDGTWELMGEFGGCFIFCKEDNRILVDIKTNIIKFECKDAS